MSNNESIPYLSGVSLEALNISTFEVIESIETLIRACEKATAWSAPKAVILPDDGRYMMAALAAADDPPYLAVKTVVLNPRNSDRQLPQINGLVTMLSSDTGLPLAILDGNWITAVRTAGLSAVAAKYMAPADASVAGFIGTGVQAKSHLKAFAEMFPLSEIRVFGRGQANIDSLCKMAESMSLKPTRCTSANDVIENSDLIVTSVTFSKNMVPFLDANRVKPGSFATITDLGAPWINENLAAFDQIVIDDVKQETALPNKLVPLDWIAGDLSGLVLGDFEGRHNPTDRNTFLFRGHALGDLAVSALAFQRSGKSG